MNNNPKIKFKKFFLFFVLLVITYRTLCMHKNLCVKTQNLAFRVIEINPSNIDDFLSSTCNWKNFTFHIGIGLKNEDQISFRPKKIRPEQIEKILDIMGDNLLELHFYNFDFSELLQNDNHEKNKYKIFEKLKQSSIIKLKFQACKNLNKKIFENLPHKLETLIIKEIYGEKINFDWLNLPETIKVLDFSDICGEFTEIFFKKIPKSTEKLKLGCPIKNKYLLYLMLLKLKSLCLKMAVMKDNEQIVLPKTISKLCVNSNFTDQDIVCLPENLETLKITTNLLSEKTPNVTGETFDKLPKKLKLIIFDTITIRTVKIENLSKLPNIETIKIKHAYPEIADTSLQEKIKYLRKRGINVIPPKRKQEFYSLKSEFTSNSDITNLLTSPSPGQSPRSASRSPSPESPSNSLKKTRFKLGQRS